MVKNGQKWSFLAIFGYFGSFLGPGDPGTLRVPGDPLETTLRAPPKDKPPVGPLGDPQGADPGVPPDLRINYLEIDLLRPYIP